MKLNLCFIQNVIVIVKYNVFKIHKSYIYIYIQSYANQICKVFKTQGLSKM